MGGKVLSLCPRKMRREDIDIKASLGNLVRLSEMGEGKQERAKWPRGESASFTSLRT